MLSVTVEEIIRGSFFLSGAWDETSTPSDGQTSMAISLLNDTLHSSPGGADVPFYTTKEWKLIAGKETYTFGTLPDVDFQSNRIISIQFAGIKYQNLYRPIKVFTAFDQFERYRVLNGSGSLFTGWPFAVYLENNVGVSSITFYPSPQEAFTASLKCKVDLDDFQPQKVILNVPPFYYKYLRYQLARELCMVFNRTSNWDELKESEYQKLLKEMRAGIALDLTIHTTDDAANRESLFAIYDGL